jgi:hypothetical protein
MLFQGGQLPWLEELPQDYIFAWMLYKFQVLASRVEPSLGKLKVPEETRAKASVLTTGCPTGCHDSSSEKSV